MAKTDLHNLDRKELLAKLEEAKVEFFNWKEAINNGKETNYGRLSQLRRNIARIKTALTEKEHADNG